MAREMKDSGIEWIGEIPVNWTTVQTLHVLSMPITDGPHTTPELYEEGIPFVSAEAISFGKGSIDFEHIRGFISEEFYNECCKKYIPQRDDIYMIKSGATTGTVSIVNTDKVFTIWSPLAVFRCNIAKMLPKYMFYSLSADCFQKQVQQAWSYGTQQNIGMRVLEHLKICLPSLEEQKVIAEYLAQQYAKINIILEKTRASIEEYKKLKQAVITQAVTKGVRGDREMKDSSIEWIGEIPADWEVKKLKYVSDFKQNKYSSVDGNLNYIGLENIVAWNGQYVYTASEYDKDQALICEPNDILFGKLRPYLAKVYISPQRQCCSGEFCVISIRGDNTRYMWYQLISHGFIFMVDRSTYGTKMPRANADYIKNMSVTIPSLDEQKTIVDYLDIKCAKIDALIAQKTALLEEMENYKKSVIYEYVTGKKEVKHH